MPDDAAIAFPGHAGRSWPLPRWRSVARTTRRGPATSVAFPGDEVVVTDLATVPVARRELPAGLDPDALDARRAQGAAFPIVGDGLCTFAFNGAARFVRLTHFGVGLPDDLHFVPIGQHWWLLSLELPVGSRLEYKLEVTNSFGTQLLEDPLNRQLASHPFGANSVCEAAGYQEPSWALANADVPAGSMVELAIESVALGRTAYSSVYRPAGYTSTPASPYPLLMVHDGGDYLQYASFTSVLDNLVHTGAIPATVVAFIHPLERLVEYADDRRHRVYLTGELVPRLEADYPLVGERGGRCLMGASFGAVATLSAAVGAPSEFGALLLQSGSFAGAGTGCWERPEALWNPVKGFVERYLTNPTVVADRIYVSCGLFESLICENRGLVPVLQGTGVDVRFVETLDGHNWASWRDSLGGALRYLLGAGAA